MHHVERTSPRRRGLAVAALLTAGVGSPALANLPTTFWSDHFVVIAEGQPGEPLLLSLDFNRGTSDVRGRERVAEFVGHAHVGGRWVDLQSGEYPYPGRDMGRLVGNGVCRVEENRAEKGWILDYDGERAAFHVRTEDEVLLHVQRDDPEMTTRHSAAEGTLTYRGKTYPATIFREHIRWRGYNRLVGRTPSRMYGHFDWIPMVSRRGDWWLLIQDPGQARVPEDAPDHNWGVYRSPDGIIRPLAHQDFRIYPTKQFPLPEKRQAPGGFEVAIHALGQTGVLRDRGHFLDRFASGLYAVDGEMFLPGVGARTVFGMVDHVEH